LLAVAQLGVEVGFVLFGKRSLDTELSVEETQIIEQYREIPEQDQRALRRFLKAMFDDATS
jgi:hypothetical protein